MVRQCVVLGRIIARRAAKSMRDEAGLPVRGAIAYNRPMSPAGPRMNATQWLICVIASIGFAFDIYELLMLPLVVGLSRV